MDIQNELLVLVPVIVGLVHAIRSTGWLRKQYVPATSILLGIVGAWVLNGNLEIIQGIIVGLSASGLWSGTKATFEKPVVVKKKK